MQVTPFITFDNNCDEAISFYEKALGAEVKSCHKAKDGESILYAHLQIGDSHIMLCDHIHKKSAQKTMSFSINTVHADKLKDTYEMLAEDGKIIMELQKTSWAGLYGEVEDKFGITWLLNLRTV